MNGYVMPFTHFEKATAKVDIFLCFTKKIFNLNF